MSHLQVHVTFTAHLGSDQPHFTGSAAAVSSYRIGWCRSKVLENFSWIRAFCLLLVYFVCPFPFYLRHVLLPEVKLYPLGRLLHRLGPSVLNKRFSCWISVRVTQVISGLWNILRAFWFVSCHLKLDPPNETLTNSVTEREKQLSTPFCRWGSGNSEGFRELLTFGLKWL